MMFCVGQIGQFCQIVSCFWAEILHIWKTQAVRDVYVSADLTFLKV